MKKINENKKGVVVIRNPSPELIEKFGDFNEVMDEVNAHFEELLKQMKEINESKKIK